MTAPHAAPVDTTGRGGEALWMQGWDQNLDFLGFSTDTVWWQGLVLPAGWDRSPRSLLNLLRCCLLRVDV